MRALSIDPQKQSIEESDIEMHVNTIFTFFSSILIDELATLDKHIIYCDANALSNKCKPYFIGGQLLLGNVIIIGRDALEDCDSTIPKKDLNTLIDYDVNLFYTEVLELLSQTNINLYRPFAVLQNDEKIELTVEWVLYTFDIADDATKEYFINELKKVLASKVNVEDYMKKMAQLAVNAAS